MNERPGLTPERATVVAVVLVAAAVLVAVALTTMAGAGGGKIEGSLRLGLLIIAVAIVIGVAFVVMVGRAAKKQRPGWMASTQEWQHVFKDRLEADARKAAMKEPPKSS